ncbi:hypothetical protein LEP1GSC194_3851 [Leptospira alstonii serovar Sichuan str. 79601]|uniref:Uncharacterized protein n=1 Tax=Leptospira alstonii serovar Sichuan str. 79601 TaxID=1218565 RepID=M6CV67_9LEPT|nr:hypothetical protein LEP1GSC194_3851 [Leptospira alstonii serovar Sichuan str. 79601]
MLRQSRVILKRNIDSLCGSFIQIESARFYRKGFYYFCVDLAFIHY